MHNFAPSISLYLIDSGNVATFSLNSTSAPLHTGASELRQSSSCNKYFRRSFENASLDSLGSSDGKWSMEMTLNGGPLLSGSSTGTVGAVKTVLMVYTGIGL
jgi:hypothetical protein